MNNPGCFDLVVLQPTGPQNALVTPIVDLDGMTAVTLEAAFQYGSAGTTFSAIVCTSFDKGNTWRHVARFDFTTASAVKIANLSGLKSNAVAAYADLGSEGVNDGLLGDRLAVRIISTGTYAGSTFSLRASVR